MKDKFGIEILDCQGCGYQDYENGFGKPMSCPDCDSGKIKKAKKDRNTYIEEGIVG